MGKSLTSPIHAVITGEGDNIEAGIFNGNGSSRVGKHGMPRLRKTGPCRRNDCLQLTKGPVGGFQGRRDALEKRYGSFLSGAISPAA
jgi:hypothetical protein